MLATEQVAKSLKSLALPRDSNPCFRRERRRSGSPLSPACPRPRELLCIAGARHHIRVGPCCGSNNELLPIATAEWSGDLAELHSRCRSRARPRARFPRALERTSRVRRCVICMSAYLDRRTPRSTGTLRGVLRLKEQFTQAVAWPYRVWLSIGHPSSPMMGRGLPCKSM